MRKNEGQLGLFGEDIPEVLAKPTITPRRTKSGKLVGPDFYENMTLAELTAEQVRRDVKAAAEELDPWWKQFFFERAEIYRNEYRKLTQENNQ